MIQEEWKVLEDYREHVWGCIRCNYCQNVHAWNLKSSRFYHSCPSFFNKRFAAYSSMGRLHIARALLEGDFEYYESSALIDIVYRCTACGACEMNCLPVIAREPLNVFEALRAELVDKAMILPEHQAYLESTIKYHNPFDAPGKERLRWTEGLNFEIKDLTKEKGKVLLYLGCMYSLEKELQSTTQTFARILHSAGVDFGFLGAKEKCCGSEQLRIGERGLFEMLAEENIEVFNALGIETLVTACPHGYYVFKSYYPRIGKMNFEVLHFTQYLKRLIDGGKIQLNGIAKQRITYSDPCNLGRLAGEYDTPRVILDSIKGVELREMERNRELTWCCGAGGGALVAFPEFAVSSAEERIIEAETTGASALATACPWCEYNFKNAADKSKTQMDLFNVAEIVFQSMAKP